MAWNKNKPLIRLRSPELEITCGVDCACPSSVNVMRKTYTMNV